MLIQHTGLAAQGGSGKLENLRIFGVLQRLAVCYFVTAVLVLVCGNGDDEPDATRWPIGKTYI